MNNPRMTVSGNTERLLKRSRRVVKERPKEEKAGMISLQEQERLPRDSRRGRQAIKPAGLITISTTYQHWGGGGSTEGEVLRSKR